MQAMLEPEAPMEEMTVAVLRGAVEVLLTQVVRKEAAEMTVEALTEIGKYAPVTRLMEQNLSPIWRFCAQ
jgi:regulatory protein YycI of two-component signal transduction system YycFG